MTNRAATAEVDVCPPARIAGPGSGQALKKTGRAIWSERLYVQIDPARVHMFRFLLEAEENLGYMSVVDRWRAVLQVTFAPGQERELRACLATIGQTQPFTLIERP